MSGLYKLSLDGFEDVDRYVIAQSIGHHLKDIELIEDKDTVDIHLCPDMIKKHPYRIGHILDIIESSLFKNRFKNIVTYEFYTLDWSNSKLTIYDEVISLSDRERDLMIELLNAGNIGCTRQSLLNKIWGYKADLETHALETQIYRLRQKIEKEPDTPQRLITIEGGYKLT